MGRKGGKAGGRKGGRARMAALSAEERSALAKKAAQARWGAKAETVKEVAEELAVESRREAVESAKHSRSATGISRRQKRTAGLAAAAASGSAGSPVSNPSTPSRVGGRAAAAGAAPAPGKPETPVAGGFSPVSENLVAARVNAGKHYEGIDWTEDPKPAGREEVQEGPDPERMQVRDGQVQVLAALVAELEIGGDSGSGSSRRDDGEDAVTEALRQALEQTRSASSALTEIRPKEEDQIRQTLFLLDEVRMTLGDDRAISLRSARKALGLWVGAEKPS